MRNITTVICFIVTFIVATPSTAAEIRYMCKIRGKTIIRPEPCPKQENPADYLPPSEVQRMAKQQRERRALYRQIRLDAEERVAQEQAASRKSRERSGDDYSVGNQRPSSAPLGAIDVTTGKFLPSVGGGFIDPSNGTFHVDVGAGAINTRTGEFSPIIK